MLGIIASVKTNLSPPQLLFRYPPIVREKITSETLQFHSQHIQYSSLNNDENICDSNPYHLSGTIISSLLLPSKELPLDYILEFEIDDCIFLSNSFPIPNHNNYDNNDRLVSFSISLAIHKNISFNVINDCKNLIKQLSLALKYTEELDQYISNESNKILKVREKWIKEQTSSSQLNKQNQSKTPKHFKLNSDILLESIFAGELKDIYHSLLSHNSVKISFNGWVKFSFVCSSLNLPNISNNNTMLNNISLRPYHTLLMIPTDTPLDTNISSQLQKLIIKSHPTRSFQELQVELGISLQQLYRLSAHLVYWNKAYIIDKITLDNIYRCNSNIVNQQLIHEFGLLFPSFSLGDCIQIFISPIKLSDALLKVNQNHFIQIIIWLLQRKILIQLYTFIYFIPQITFNNDKITQDNIIESLNDGPSKTYLLFIQLLPYFNGKISIREIIWRENITRSSIDKVLLKFKDVLITTLHENITYN